MNKILIGAVALALLAGTTANAQPGRDDHASANQHPGWGKDYGGNHKWKRGERVGYNDWQSAQVVDYRAHKLRKPPRGYEWRQSNGQYILAAVATGLIASIIINNSH